MAQASYPGLVRVCEVLFGDPPRDTLSALSALRRATQNEPLPTRAEALFARLSPVAPVWPVRRAFSLLGAACGDPAAPLALCLVAAYALAPSEPSAAALDFPGRVLLGVRGAVFDLTRPSLPRARPMMPEEIEALYKAKTAATRPPGALAALSGPDCVARLLASEEYGATRRGDSAALRLLASLR